MPTAYDRALRPGEVWRGALALVRRYPGPALAPAALIGLCADALQLIGGGPITAIAVGLGLAIVFELYVAYAERLVLEAHRGADVIVVSDLLRGAGPLVPSLLAASVLATSLPVAASGLLLLPGLWLLTRWSLFAPAIARDGLGALTALRSSGGLVRGRFWPVFATATVALLLEHGVIHGTALSAEPVLGSQLLALLAAGIAVAVVSPLAAFAISLTYDRLADGD
jgi:hypothetical protein